MDMALYYITLYSVIPRYIRQINYMFASKYINKLHTHGH